MTTDRQPLKDDGDFRFMAARWVITADMTLESAAYFGGKGDSPVDMTVLRDALTGAPLLTGATVAGALRSHLADVFGGYYSDEHSKVAALFGGVSSDEEGEQSPLIVFDSLGRLPRDKTVEIRDGVAINPETGVAETGKKFDMEALPAGTVFPLRFELIVADTGKEADLISYLTAALEGLANGEIAMGARRTRGLGVVKATDWHADRYDLTKEEGWLAWLFSEAKTETLMKQTATRYDAPEKAIAFEAKKAGLTLETIPDRRNRMTIQVELEFSSGLLIRSPATGPKAPDAIHLTSGGESVLPGTSLAGVLRNRALKIARLVRKGNGDADDWIHRMFGPRPKENEKEDLAASRLRISESVIQNGTRMRPTRIKIDRFTQGVHKGALFDEEPDYGGKTRIHIELRMQNGDSEKDKAECGLILLLLKDLLSGDIVIGGAGSVGRGKVRRGTATICFSGGKKIAIDPNLSVTEEDKVTLNKMITAFHQAAEPVQKKKEGGAQ